ncbi:MAG TPA: oligoendopeptidase F, partial [Acetobacteraceae bacterium]|nr:oligoendopeptidase F [Acetobacteraceae bacterium]
MPDGQAGSKARGAASDRAELPTWDLRDLYPSPDSPQLAADLDHAEAEGKAFAAAYAGKLAEMSGAALAAAVSEYERIEETLGRVM